MALEFWEWCRQLEWMCAVECWWVCWAWRFGEVAMAGGCGWVDSLGRGCYYCDHVCMGCALGGAMMMGVHLGGSTTVGVV